MEILKSKGYTSYQVPSPSNADDFLQKRIDIDFLDDELYINAYVYDPKDYKPVRTVEFQFQIDSELDPSIRTKLFGVQEEELSGRRIDQIEEKLRNLFIYSHYA